MTADGELGERGAARSVWLVVLALVISAIAFSRTLSGGFITDDHLLIERNLASGQVVGALGKPMWEFDTPAGQPTVGYWRPLATLALALGQGVGGGRPAGFHAISLGLHLLATWAAFRLARRMTQDVRVAFFAA